MAVGMPLRAQGRQAALTLRRQLLSGTASTSTASSSRPALPSASASVPASASRSIHLTPLLLAKKGGGAPPPPPKPELKPTGPLRDENIPASTVRWVHPETNALSAPVPLSRLLSSIDRQRYWAVQAKEADEDAQGDERFPIIRLVDKKEAYAREKAKAAAKKAAAAQGSGGASGASAASASKEVQLTWSSTSHDASHKLDNAKQHLVRRGPGAKVTVSISSKKGKGAMGGSDSKKRADMIQMVDDALLGEMGGEGAEGEGTSQVPALVRRKGETEWLRNGSAALLHYEVVKSK